MKEKVFTLRLSLFIAIITFTLSLFIKFSLEQTNLYEFIYDMTLGLFSGAIISVLIYITEYTISKRKTLEDYYIKSIELLDKIGSLKYFNLSEEYRLLLNYWKEETNIDTNSIARQELIKYYNISNFSNGDIDKDLNTKMEQLKKELVRVIDSYIEVSLYKYRSIEDAYREIYFFTNQKERTKIYNQIHDVQRGILNLVKEESIHFKLYKEDNTNNFLAVCNILDSLQTKLFSIEIRKSDITKSMLVYKKYFNEMDQVLENFRAKIYKDKPKKFEGELVVSYTTLIK